MTLLAVERDATSEKSNVSFKSLSSEGLMGGWDSLCLVTR
jgi:hypothetical protein